jgi:hypothetical protein
MFFHPVPSMEELNQFYANEYPIQSEDHYHFEQEYNRPGLLDVADHLIQQARYFGVDASGNEINSDWVRMGKTVLSDKITDEPFSQYFANSLRQPHLITFLHTLEHTPDPLDLLLDVRLKLDSKGILYIVVPNVLFLPAVHFGRKADENFLYPTHPHYFSPKSIRCLLRAAGFRILHLETRPSHFSPSSEESFWQKPYLDVELRMF